MAQAKQGDTVKVHYTGKLGDGTVFDSSANRGPLQFTLGGGQIIRGFDEAVTGMNVGETKTVKLASDKAYGPHRNEMIAMVERSQLPRDLNPAVGQTLQIRNAQGRTMVVRVVDVSEAKVTLDGNHPLAGKELTFEIQLVEVA